VHRPAGGLPDGTLDAIQGHPRPIRHEYFRIDNATLWEVISTETHTLNTVMEAMLARHAGEDPRSRFMNP
jgi:hypothetical protein